MSSLRARRLSVPKLARIINAWQAQQTTLIHAAGTPETLWGVDSEWNLNDTFIDPGYAFRQDGLLRQVTMQVSTTADISSLTAKLKIFRLSSGTTYDFVAEQAFTPPISKVREKITINLSPPIAVQMGDMPGIYWYSIAAAGTLDAKSLPAWLPKTRFVAADVGAQANFTSEHTSHISMEWFIYNPYLAVTGDSIAAGHNGAAGWYSGLENGGASVLPGGVATSEIMNQLRAKIGDGTVLLYQNQSLGSQTFAWVASTGADLAHKLSPHTIIIHCGINDILTDRTWANVETDLNTIKTVLSTDNVIIDEILPCTNATDVRAANIRTFNTNLATWCLANNVQLVSCWSQFGKLRAATGFNDDMITALTQDGTHLSTAGVDMLANIWKSYL